MIDGKRTYKKKPNAKKVKLTSEGWRQGRDLKRCIDNLGLQIDICFYSEFHRTYQMAKIVCGSVPLLPARGLNERNLGDFTDIKREDFHKFFKEESALKKRDPLGWRPRGGQTLHEKAQQIVPVLKDAASREPGGCVAFSCHADVMVGLRSLPQLTGLGNKELTRTTPPLTLGLPNPLWIQNAQLDIYQWETGQLPSYFRSIATSGTKFDTGWRPLSTVH